MSNSKIVFVRPPNLQKSGLWKKQGVIRAPINLGLMASFLRERAGYDCSLVDFEITEASSVKEMAEVVLRESPRYVCTTTLTPRYPTVVLMAQEIKRLEPDVITIVGGPHVTGNPQAALFEGISYGIVGEGEEALLELLNVLDQGCDPSGVKNLVYREDGEIKVNPIRPFIKNLDALPFPAWDLMTLDEYLDPIYFKGPHLGFLSGRGCPFDCNFCASHLTWKGKLRLRSVENVMDEIRHIVNVLGIRNVIFFDDSFAISKRRALAICRCMIEEQLNLKYVAQIRADSVTKELAEALRDSGCIYAAIGVESGNEEILRQVGKKETKSQIRNAVAILKDAGLPIIASYVLGLPGDTDETIQQTIDFAFELDTEQSKFMILAAYPGTKVYDMAVERGLVDPTSFEQMESLNFYDSVGINLSEVSDEALIRYQDEAYARFDELRCTR
ncbi:B12-binding domain-containing radical SAM protein [Planctomycetota bacterium]